MKQSRSTICRWRVHWVALSLLFNLSVLLAVGCGEQRGLDAAARVQLEQEVEQLRAANAELDRLQAENQELERLRRDNEELKRLVEGTRDLEKLRQENAQLRAELQSLKPRRPASPFGR